MKDFIFNHYKRSKQTLANSRRNKKGMSVSFPFTTQMLCTTPNVRLLYQFFFYGCVSILSPIQIPSQRIPASIDSHKEYSRQKNTQQARSFYRQFKFPPKQFPVNADSHLTTLKIGCSIKCMIIINVDGKKLASKMNSLAPVNYSRSC